MKNVISFVKEKLRESGANLSEEKADILASQITAEVAAEVAAEIAAEISTEATAEAAAITQIGNAHGTSESPHA